jgi:putative transposase
MSRFPQLLTYKAELVDKKVIRVDEKYTSKMCCCCGNIHTMELKDREMICDCGNQIDRDRNSAINIMIRFLSQNALWTGYRQFVGNLRYTGSFDEKAYVKYALELDVLASEASESLAQR